MLHVTKSPRYSPYIRPTRVRCLSTPSCPLSLGQTETRWLEGGGAVNGESRCNSVHFWSGLFYLPGLTPRLFAFSDYPRCIHGDGDGYRWFNRRDYQHTYVACAVCVHGGSVVHTRGRLLRGAGFPKVKQSSLVLEYST